MPDTGVPAVVAARLRTFRRIVYQPAAPTEASTELVPSLAAGTRLKQLQDSYSHFFTEQSLDNLGPGVAPQSMNRGPATEAISQLQTALDIRRPAAATLTCHPVRFLSHVFYISLARMVARSCKTI